MVASENTVTFAGEVCLARLASTRTSWRHNLYPPDFTVSSVEASVAVSPCSTSTQIDLPDRAHLRTLVHVNCRHLWKSLLLYTCILGLLTVGAVYLATHSGFYTPVLTGSGLLLVVLGGGTAGKMGSTQTENAGGKGGTELMVSSPGLQSPLNTDTPVRLTFLFYGLGVFLWSPVILGTFRDTLV